jgi:hypothetical protein
VGKARSPVRGGWNLLVWVVLCSVCLDVQLFDTQCGFRERFLCFPVQFPLQPRRTDAGAVLETQPSRTELLGPDLDGELTGLMRWVDDMKRICARSKGIIYADILYVHASTLS